MTAHLKFGKEMYNVDRQQCDRNYELCAKMFIVKLAVY